MGEATGFRERAKAVMSGSAPGRWLRGLSEGGRRWVRGRPEQAPGGARRLLGGHSPVFGVAVSEAFGEGVAGDLELRDLRGRGHWASGSSPSAGGPRASAGRWGAFRGAPPGRAPLLSADSTRPAAAPPPWRLCLSPARDVCGASFLGNEPLWWPEGVEMETLGPWLGWECGHLHPHPAAEKSEGAP